MHPVHLWPGFGQLWKILRVIRGQRSVRGLLKVEVKLGPVFCSLSKDKSFIAHSVLYRVRSDAVR